MFQPNGISLHVEDHSSGKPVVSLHGCSALSRCVTDACRSEPLFLPRAGPGASEAYRRALSSFAANGTDLTDAFTGRLARGIRNRLMNEFRHVSSPSLPFPVQHALTQTVATPASAQGALELMTIWAGQNASLCHSTDATDFMTQLIAEAETVFSEEK